MSAPFPRAGAVAMAGALSGALVGLWLSYGLDAFHDMGEVGNTVSIVSIYGGPGIFYGIIVGAVLRRPLNFQLWRWGAWILCAALSYAAALILALWLYGSRQDLALMNFLAGGAAGSLGAALLSGASAALFASFRNLRRAIDSVLAGGLIGLALPAVLASNLLAMIVFLAVWQGAYAVASTQGGSR